MQIILTENIGIPKIWAVGLIFVIFCPFFVLIIEPEKFKYITMPVYISLLAIAGVYYGDSIYGLLLNGAGNGNSENNFLEIITFFRNFENFPVVLAASSYGF